MVKTVMAQCECVCVCVFFSTRGMGLCSERSPMYLVARGVHARSRSSLDSQEQGRPPREITSEATSRNIPGRLRKRCVPGLGQRR